MPLEYSLVLHADTPAAVTLEGRPADPHDCLLLQQVGGLDGAPVDQDVNPWPGGDGDILGQLSVRGRTLSVEGLIVAPSRGRLRELERDLRRACAPTVDTWPVVVDGRVGDPALSLDVRTGEPLVTVDEGASSQGWGKAFRVTFRSGSSTLRSHQQHTRSVLPPAPGGGLVFPLVFPLVFTGPAATPSGITVTNQGDAPAWPRLLLHGELVNPVVWNVSTGQRLALHTTIFDGETVTLDGRARTAAVDGPSGGNRYHTIDRSVSDWWQLHPGDNLIRLLADGAGPNGHATVVWNDAYL